MKTYPPPPSTLEMRNMCVHALKFEDDFIHHEAFHMKLKVNDNINSHDLRIFRSSVMSQNLWFPPPPPCETPKVPDKPSFYKEYVLEHMVVS